MYRLIYSLLWRTSRAPLPSPLSHLMPKPVCVHGPHRDKRSGACICRHAVPVTAAPASPSGPIVRWTNASSWRRRCRSRWYAASTACVSSVPRAAWHTEHTLRVHRSCTTRAAHSTWKRCLHDSTVTHCPAHAPSDTTTQLEGCVCLYPSRGAAGTSRSRPRC